MACRLFGAKPLSKTMPGYYQLDPKEQTSVKFNQSTKRFIHENVSQVRGHDIFSNGVGYVWFEPLTSIRKNSSNTGSYDT